MMSVETEQRHLQCSSLSPPLAKASAGCVSISAEAFFKDVFGYIFRGQAQRDILLR